MSKCKEEIRKMKIERAKRTMLGRFLCRLFGDEAGQTMMEYVIIGVMVAAAAVAVVLLFGKEIRVKFNEMIDAIKGTPQSHTSVSTTDMTNAENTAQQLSTSSGTAK